MFALRSLHAANLATREEHLASEARFLADQLSTFHGTLRESTQRLGGLFEKRFSAGLSAHPDEPVAVTAKKLEKLAADLRQRLIGFAESLQRLPSRACSRWHRLNFPICPKSFLAFAGVGRFLSLLKRFIKFIKMAQLQERLPP